MKLSFCCATQPFATQLVQERARSGFKAIARLKSTAANAISQEMQDQVAVVGSPEECRAEIEKRRALGLQLPVVAPFTVAEPKESYRRVITAFEG